MNTRTYTLLVFLQLLFFAGCKNTVQQDTLQKQQVNTQDKIVSVTGIILAQSDELEIGKNKTLTAAVIPATATNKKVTWTSSDPNVIALNSTTDTVVTLNAIAKQVGKTAVITATSEDGNKTASCIVTVTHIKVPYSELERYLENSASATEVNYIEVTGNIPVSDLIGSYDTSKRLGTSSAFGKKFNDTPTKRVALKLPHIAEENRDMSFCFYKCSSLVKVENLPQTVTNMESCFESCSNLTDIPALPEKVNKLSNCFLKCEALTKASITAEYATMMDGCFYGCTKLQEVAITSESIHSMEDCFTNCENLQKILSLPNKAVNWYQCFSNCSNLKELPAIPATANNIQFCFADCSALTSVTLNCDYDHLTDKKEAFDKCFSLNDGSIKVPEAFYDNYTTTNALQEMAIPGDTTEERRAKFATIKQD